MRFTFYAMLLSGVLSTTSINATTKESKLHSKTEPITNYTENELDSLLNLGDTKKLSEVVIMGFKQDKTLQLSPQSGISLNAKSIQQENLTNIKNLSGVVSNLYMPDYGSKLTSPIYIRGIGNKTGTPAVGLYIDGIPYFQQSTFDFNLHYIEQIDILKGPQGTLYGRNTMGGVIDVNTKSPLDHQGTTFSFTGGNYNAYTLSIDHSLLLRENMGLSVSGSYNFNEGFYYNNFLKKKADRTKGATGRIRYDWMINPKLYLRVISALDFTNQGGYPYAPYNGKSNTVENIAYDGDSSYRRLISSSGLNLKYYGDGFKINNQISFQYYNDKQRIDQDFTSQPLNFTKQDQKQSMLSNEFNIKSDNHSKYQWLFGAFGFFQRIKNEVNVDFIPQKYISQKHYNIPTYGFALYHQSTINDILFKGLSASAGIRFDYEHAKNRYDSFKINATATQPNGDFRDKLNFRQVTPKFTLQYLSPSEQNIYATVTRGYKTGGFNTSFNTPSDRTYKPEYSWNYEIGTKVNFLDNRIQADLALFYIDWKDQQVTQPTETGVGRLTNNAGKSASKGFEVGITAKPIENLVIRANYGYTKAYYKHYSFFDPKLKAEVNYRDKRIPMVPTQTVSADVLYTIRPKYFLDKIELGLNYVGTGKIYWEDTNEHFQKYYSLLNGRIAMYRNNISISLWSKNITNTDYIVYCFKTSKLYGQEGRPFTIGGTFTYTF